MLMGTILTSISSRVEPRLNVSAAYAAGAFFEF
ncbi:hypothetical protein SAMN05421578_12315 [Paenibacillus macquariensis]|uniref:Uncharacterized protein n=1 Tax=Paenibacillus macquariensis TaxID=948756 RepID=A0ABY1KCN8_9BACL|nr:hypothetical protein SAMN05421578_12315 [Paenibacillus macquariensis]